MISQWSAEEFLGLLSNDRKETLADFLEVDLEDVNRAQRIVLIAEEFDYALLVGTEWLSKNFSVDVMCCRISVAKDVGSGTEYLVCSNVYNAGGLSPPDKLEPTFGSMVDSTMTSSIGSRA
jgi:hypothetical protein